jgi:hypothetical protein
LGVRFYRIIRAVNRAYSLAVLWLYIAAFIVAVVLMFMYPIGTIALVWAGLVGIVLVLLAGKSLAVLQRAVARRALARGRCPGCAATLEGESPSDSDLRRCDACGSVFLSTGAEETESSEAGTAPSP